VCVKIHHKKVNLCSTATVYAGRKANYLISKNERIPKTNGPIFIALNDCKA
jgi:hypothetical protein